MWYVLLPTLNDRVIFIFVDQVIKVKFISRVPARQESMSMVIMIVIMWSTSIGGGSAVYIIGGVGAVILMMILFFRLSIIHVI